MLVHWSVSWLVGRLVGWLVGWSVGVLLGSSPEGVDDLCFHTNGEFSPPPSSPSSPYPPPPSSLMGFGPQDWDLGLQAGMWASRLRYGLGGWAEGGAEEKKEDEEKIPHLCESIGH